MPHARRDQSEKTGLKTTSSHPGQSDEACDSMHGFCPHMGLIASSALEFEGQVRNLLRGRLRIAAIILFGGFAAFFLQSLMGDAEFARLQSAIRIPHVIVTLAEGLLVVLLCRKCQLSLRALHAAEVVMFALPAAFLAFMQYQYYTLAPSGDAAVFAYRYLSSGVSWILLLEVYGLFIPNSCRRTAVVVALMALGPTATAVAAGFQQPLIFEALRNGALSVNLLQMSIAAVIAVYGSHRFGALRQEAFDLKKVGVYTLKRKLGSGGMGEVFLAEHRLLKRPCAVKIIRPDRAGDASAAARFESEVQAAAGLTHPNTIEIYDYGLTADGVFFYVMEFLPGMSLQEIVERTGPMSPARVIHLLRQVCEALEEAHATGLIHRDIKPANVFAAERGGIRDFAKLLDFGLVKSTGPVEGDANHTLEGVVVGSPMYSAPETTVGGGPVDARADIYSLGATAYFVLTGRPVFKGEQPLQIVFAHAKEAPVPPTEIVSEIPRDLEAIVLKCLAKSPDDRFSSAAELESALASCTDADAWSREDAERWWSASSDFPFEEESTPPSDEYAETAVGRVVEA